MEYNLQWPFAEIQKESAAYAATVALPKVINRKAHYTVAQLTGDVTFTVTESEQLLAGAELVVILTADGTNRTATFSTGFKSATVAVNASKNVVVTFEYDGVDFRQKSVGANN